MKKLKEIFKKIIISFFLLYGYNNLVLPINMTIPINILTLLLVVVFGIPSLLALILIKLIFFY